MSNVIPGRVQNVDDIVSICAGLCNLQPELIQMETEDEEASQMDEGEDLGEQEGEGTLQRTLRKTSEKVTLIIVNVK